MKKLAASVLAIVCLFMAASAQADSFAYAGSSSGAFGTIDLNTGVFTLLGNSGQTLAGLAVANGSIFATSYHTADGTLFEVNPTNGALTSIGTATGIGYDDFGSTTTGLYAVSLGATQNLYSINPTTGAATLIGPTGLGYGSWRGLSTNSSTLYFADGADLYTLNTSTGAATLVGAFGGSAELGVLLTEGGTLFGGDDTNGTVDTINVSTGAATVGPKPSASFSGSFYGLAPYPVPGAPEVITAVENSANFQVKSPTAPAAPNSLISVYANNLGSVSGSNLFPETSFQGVQVLFNGAPAPLYYVNGAVNLINLAVPSNLPTTGSATLSVQTPAGTTANFALPLAPTDVGIFRLSADPAHPNNGAVTIADSQWLVMPASTASAYGLKACTGLPPSSICGQPAPIGSYIVIYFTGGGLATPNGTPSGQPVASGSVAPVDGSTIYDTVQTPTLTIGGVSAPVLFSGIAPGTAAEYQINTTIPTGVQPGDSVPVVVTFGNTSDTVTIAVQ